MVTLVAIFSIRRRVQSVELECPYSYKVLCGSLVQYCDLEMINQEFYVLSLQTHRTNLRNLYVTINLSWQRIVKIKKNDS